MNALILAFVVGVTWVQHWPRLPGAYEWSCLLLACVVLGWLRQRLACVLLLGVIWACCFASWRMTDVLDVSLQGRDVVVQGYILSLPQLQDGRASFDFQVTQAITGVPEKIRLNWYKPPADLAAGQAWRIVVRLKRPHGRHNPGGFDYEAWLFSNHIGATGYVRPDNKNKDVELTFNWQRGIAISRQMLSRLLDAAMPDSPQLGVIKALTIGSQDLISRQQWMLYRKTGVVHLMVISGSHISLIAGLVFVGVRRGWARWGCLRWAPQNVSALAAWLAAVFYAALAGFSVPTQRAVVMLTIGLLSVVWQRHSSALQILLLALLAVVAFDPLAVLSAGFWLSFTAVALLLIATTGRLGKLSYWRGSIGMHFVMAIGLAPLLVVFFQQVSIVSPLANLFAVPLVGLVITPAALLASVVALWSVYAAGLLLWPVGKLLQGLELMLQHMAAWPVAVISTMQPAWYAVLLALIGVLLFLVPKGFPARYLSPLFFLPLGFMPIPRPEPGQVWLTLLDVGQGLAVVLQTASHAVIFDTGAKFAEQSDMGESVVLPYCRHDGINKLDALIISHADNDHSGGAAAVLEELPVNAVFSSEAQWAEQAGATYCRAGHRWDWDGVTFSFLSPMEGSPGSENDRSCVLKVTGSRHSFLLTGDIEQNTEKQLVKNYGATLQSTIMIAPHHGSKTSSSMDFLQQVQAEWVLIPAGYMNRFGFPHQQVLQRYKSLGLKSLISGEQGAISVKTHDKTLLIEGSRRQSLKYWMQELPD